MSAETYAEFIGRTVARKAFEAVDASFMQHGYSGPSSEFTFARVIAQEFERERSKQMEKTMARLRKWFDSVGDPPIGEAIVAIEEVVRVSFLT
jgi:hypothetical protein